MVCSESDASADHFRETESVSAADARFETLMLGLRMNEGVSAAFFRRLHGVSLDEVYGPRLRSLEARRLLIHDLSSDSWRLSRRGQDIQNAVLVELMD